MKPIKNRERKKGLSTGDCAAAFLLKRVCKEDIWSSFARGQSGLPVDNLHEGSACEQACRIALWPTEKRLEKRRHQARARRCGPLLQRESEQASPAEFALLRIIMALMGS